jgi:hypothetical protein
VLVAVLVVGVLRAALPGRWGRAGRVAWMRVLCFMAGLC